MSSGVEQLLNWFDALSDAEKHEAATEVLRRMLRSAPPELPDESLVAVAEELFLDLDAGEAGDDQP